MISFTVSKFNEVSLICHRLTFHNIFTTMMVMQFRHISATCVAATLQCTSRSSRNLLDTKQIFTSPTTQAPVELWLSITIHKATKGFPKTYPLETYQGCALAEPGGPWRLTFALGRLENHRFFIQIIRWAP